MGVIYVRVEPPASPGKLWTLRPQLAFSHGRPVCAGQRLKTIVLSHQAEKDLAALSVDARSTVRAALHAYAVRGTGDVKRLRGSDFLRLRAGRYRIIFAEDGVTILAIYIGKRETSTYRKGRL